MSLSHEDRESLVAYLDGELDDEAAQELEARLNLDPEARAEVEALRQTWGLLDYLPRAQPSDSFTNRTMERLSLVGSGMRTGEIGKTRRLSTSAWLGWAAAILLAVAAGVGGARLVYHKSPTPPVDLDETIARQLRVLEKWRIYEPLDDLDFLRALDHPDLFGEETGS